MSNLPSRQELNNSTPQLSSNQLPREYRVTGTTPQQARASVQSKANAGIATPANIFWITLGIHGVLIGIELYMAHKAGWI